MLCAQLLPCEFLVSRERRPRIRQVKMEEEELPVRSEGASAANETNANSTPQQVEVEGAAAESLGRWPSVSLTNCFSSLALRAVESSPAEAHPEDGAERSESPDLTRQIAGLSIARGRAREETSAPEEQQLRPAAERLAGFKLPKAYFCGYCPRTFHNVAFYCRHLRRHRNLWRCDKGNQGFESLALQSRHRRVCVKLWRHRNKRKYYG